MERAPQEKPGVKRRISSVLNEIDDSDSPSNSLMTTHFMRMNLCLKLRKKPLLRLVRHPQE